MAVDMELLKKHLPSEESINEYVEFLQKEQIALQSVWNPYLKETKESGKKNDMIFNHLIQMTNQYQQLMGIAAAFKDPKAVAEALEMAKNMKVSHDPQSGSCDCHHKECNH